METMKGKLAIVTGGNSGIGYATAKAFRAAGATVIITGRRKDALEAAAQELDVIPFVANQSHVSDTERLVKYVEDGYGKVDILFINAGITGSKSMQDVSERFFDDIMNVNFRGAYFVLSRFIPILADGASVVFLSSCVASMNGAYSTVYSASKAALNSVMRIAAVELAPRKIRVNSVSPGPTATEILVKTGMDEETLATIHERLLDRIPLHEMGRPEDVADLVLHLCSDASRFVTGSDFLIDGGLSL